jgi:hypothetical protein
LRSDCGPPAATFGFLEDVQPSEMSDCELLRHGLVVRYMGSPESGLDACQRQPFAARLKAIRLEWEKRFPTLPLVSTFQTDGYPDE